MIQLIFGLIFPLTVVMVGIITMIYLATKTASLVYDLEVNSKKNKNQFKLVSIGLGYISGVVLGALIGTFLFPGFGTLAGAFTGLFIIGPLLGLLGLNFGSMIYKAYAIIRNKGDLVPSHPEKYCLNVNLLAFLKQPENSPIYKDKIIEVNQDLLRLNRIKTYLSNNLIWWDKPIKEINAINDLINKIIGATDINLLLDAKSQAENFINGFLNTKQSWYSRVLGISPKHSLALSDADDAKIQRIVNKTLDLPAFTIKDFKSEPTTSSSFKGFMDSSHTSGTSSLNNQNLVEMQNLRNFQAKK